MTCCFKNPKKSSWNSTEFDFDACINELEEEMFSSKRQNEELQDQAKSNSAKIFKIETKQLHDIKKLQSKAKIVEVIADKLYSSEVYDEALEFYEQLLSIQRKLYYTKSNHNNTTSSSQTSASLIQTYCKEKPLKDQKFTFQKDSTSTFSSEKNHGIEFHVDESIATTLRSWSLSS